MFLSNTDIGKFIRANIKVYGQLPINTHSSAVVAGTKSCCSVCQHLDINRKHVDVLPSINQVLLMLNATIVINIQ